jgi:hypothetical protein
VVPPAVTLVVGPVLFELSVVFCVDPTVEFKCS